MSTLMQASRQWASRPNDQRFVSIDEMITHARQVRANSAAKVLSNRSIEARPVDGDRDSLVVVGPNGAPVSPTHWAFGQLAQRAGAPAGYLRDLPGPLAADCINYGLKMRDVEEIGVLLTRSHQLIGATMDGPTQVNQLTAVTGPNYGRVWNETILTAVRRRFGDGLTGQFRIPGEFGKPVPINKQNTTLYASDRDMFIFLADEQHSIEVRGRRDGNAGVMSRGFFMWNSEVGSQTFGLATFLFDYVCQNRIVWGAQDYREIRVRHTASAPHRFIEEVAPMLEKYSNSSTANITTMIEDARAKRIDNVDEFLAKRFNKSEVGSIKAAHMSDEQRPIENLWDAATGVTAYAREIQHQDRRVAIEREAGKILDLVA